jgi:hypothetical protein
MERQNRYEYMDAFFIFNILKVGIAFSEDDVDILH